MANGCTLHSNYGTNYVCMVYVMPRCTSRTSAPTRGEQHRAVAATFSRLGTVKDVRRKRRSTAPNSVNFFQFICVNAPFARHFGNYICNIYLYIEVS